MVVPERLGDTLMLVFFVSEGNAECFLIDAVNTPIRVGVPFDIPVLMKDGYDHPAIPPPDLKPSLQCRWVTALCL